jgi:hypothetical protein
MSLQIVADVEATKELIARNTGLSDDEKVIRSSLVEDLYNAVYDPEVKKSFLELMYSTAKLEALSVIDVIQAETFWSSYLKAKITAPAKYGWKGLKFFGSKAYDASASAISGAMARVKSWFGYTATTSTTIPTLPESAFFSVVIDKLTSLNVAWVNHALCIVFGLEYEDETSKSAIAKPTLLSLFNAMSVESFDGSVYNNVLSDLKALEIIGKQVYILAAKPLNDAVVAGHLGELTLDALMGQQTGGAMYNNTDYYAIANAIKHNNYMLYNYAANTLGNQYNVNNYTMEMHGGRKQPFDVNQIVGKTPGDLTLNKARVDASLDVDSDSAYSLAAHQNVSEIVAAINEQLSALKNKGKKLSDNSNLKVKAVLKEIIDAHNKVNGLLESLDTFNAFPSRVPNAPANITLTEGDGATADFNRKQAPFAELKEAIRRKNKSDLRGLAVSEGLSKALYDLVSGIVTGRPGYPAPAGRKLF